MTGVYMMVEKTSKKRVIMHLDMDAFFVNVELLKHPDLRGQKIIVARESERSVVLSASYEARAYGVHSAMPLAQAKRACPGATLIEPSAPYREYSARVMEILHELTDRVEQVSVDEAFVDFTPTIKRLGAPVATAQHVRQKIQTELELPCSAGIAGNKFIAKMASSGSKPNGLWVIPPQRVQEFLDPLRVGKLWGVGPKTATSIEGMGIYTVAQLRSYDIHFLQQRFGASLGAHLFNICRGRDDRPVVTEREEKSMGAEHTFTRDTYEVDEITRELFKISMAVARRLRSADKYAQSLSLKIRYEGFETLNRSCLLKTPTDSGQKIYRAVMERIDELGIVEQDKDGASIVPRAIRLLGVRAEKLDSRSSGFQESLFADDFSMAKNQVSADWYAVESTMDDIQSRFGASGLLPAKLLNAQQDRG